MDGPEPPDEIHRVDADDRAIGEELAEDAEGEPVFRVVEGRDEDGRVADVEVRVGGREAPPVEEKRRGHRDKGDFDLRAILEPQALEPLAVLLEGGVVLVGAVLLAAENDGAGAGESRDVVHVSVRVVAGDAPVQPEDIAGAQKIAEDLFVVAPRHPGIANLDMRIEQALLGRQEGSGTVDVDRAPLQDDVPTARARGQKRQAERSRHPRRNGVVLPPVVVTRPAVESKTADGGFGPPAFAPDERRARIARPAPVGRQTKELDRRIAASGAGEDPFRGQLLRLSADEHPHDFPGRQPPDHLAVGPGDRAELPRPVGPVVGPADPGRLVALPLGRKPGWGEGHASSRSGAFPTGPRRGTAG